MEITVRRSGRLGVKIAWGFRHIPLATCPCGRFKSVDNSPREHLVNEKVVFGILWHIHCCNAS